MPTEMRDAYLEVVRAWVPPATPVIFESEDEIGVYLRSLEDSARMIGFEFVGRVIRLRTPLIPEDIGALEVITYCDLHNVHTGCFAENYNDLDPQSGRAKSFSPWFFSNYLLFSPDELTSPQIKESQRVLADANCRRAESEEDIRTI